jgi:hypothetical protein
MLGRVSLDISTFCLIFNVPWNFLQPTLNVMNPLFVEKTDIDAIAGFKFPLFGLKK